MNKKDDKNTPVDNQETNNLLKELGVMNLASGFESDIQYINIIGSIEGHMVLPQENKTTKYEHLIPQLVAEGWQIVSVSELFKAKGLELKDGQVYNYAG